MLHFIYDHLLAHGFPPSLRDIAAHHSISVSEARTAVANLKVGKTVLPHPVTGEIWMAGAFASQPTDYRVVGKSVTWFANCAWDMIGIAVVANQDVRIETRCAHCDVAITIDAFPDRAPRGDGIIHFLVPARKWYDDIGFT